jgi:hypothetical protein
MASRFGDLLVYGSVIFDTTPGAGVLSSSSMGMAIGLPEAGTSRCVLS